MESIEYNHHYNNLHLVYIYNKETSLFFHSHIYQLIFLFFFLSSTSIFLSLQLVQFSIIFVVSSSSFDNSVILILKSFLLINSFNVFCSSFNNILFVVNVLLIVVVGRKKNICHTNK